MMGLAIGRVSNESLTRNVFGSANSWPQKQSSAKQRPIGRGIHANDAAPRVGDARADVYLVCSSCGPGETPLGTRHLSTTGASPHMGSGLGDDAAERRARMDCKTSRPVGRELVFRFDRNEIGNPELDKRLLETRIVPFYFILE